ncbi:response regulator transcription factor [Pseudonocardia xinjiangensis]|uniref:Response regulator transcription factor n=2 Tax=Pseudonocardia xinjiangensis TaxID=75289 RepID=A0ABX1RFR7_9PSEU|nr:response regulator transcription factor [Pseudonocardia xinjiangensis]
MRILIAEDQAMVRGALVALLELEDDLRVVAQVARGDEVVPAARATQPDVALLDIEMPGGDGLTATTALTAALPGCRVVVLTTFGRAGYLRRAMSAGASGFLLKDAPSAELAGALRRVLAGERVVDPGLAALALSEGENPLTDRERDVLRAAACGAPVGDVAGRLFLSRGTVRNHLSSAIRKTGTRTRIEAVRAAEERGWL